MSVDMLHHHVYMPTETCNISIVIYGYADHSPITVHDLGASDLSPWQHIDHIVT